MGAYGCAFPALSQKLFPLFLFLLARALCLRLVLVLACLPLSLLHAMAAAAGAGAMDRALDASKKYQKKTPLEHVLLRPDTYVGSIEVRAAAAALVSRGVCAPAGLSFSRCCTGA